MYAEFDVSGMFDWPCSYAYSQLSVSVERQSAAHPKLIFCSGERSVNRIVEALRAGADEYIMKPFDSDIIRSKFALVGLIEETSCAAA